VVHVIFDECATLDLSGIISYFIADRFNHLPIFFTVLQLRCVCYKMRQLSTNSLVEIVLTKLKFKPCQNQRNCEISPNLWNASGMKKFVKAKPSAPKVNPENKKVDVEIVDEIDDDESK
jgi:hypothetical protein